ncbi:MAG: hypothetical protein J6T24_03850 [Clostridia bacterium]|nr:hypothetical protein [Clostridia bacterium]
MKRAHIILIAAILVLCMISLSSCVAIYMVDYEYERGKEKGLYFDDDDLDGSVWECTTANIKLYFFRDGTTEMQKMQYKKGETVYYGHVSLIRRELILMSEIVEPGLVESFEENPENLQVDKNGFVDVPTSHETLLVGTYVYENDAIVVKVSYSHALLEDEVETHIIFEKTDEEIPLEPNISYRCRELDMYLLAYDSIEGYYWGQVTFAGDSFHIKGTRQGNSQLYQFLGEYGLCFYAFVFEEKEALIFRLTDEHPNLACRWEYQGATLTFTQEPLLSGVKNDAQHALQN